MLHLQRFVYISGLLLLVIALCTVQAQDHNGPVYIIEDFGAASGLSEMNTEAIQEAIDRCAADGGGTVWVPSGIFVSGPLFMKSNVRLHLDAGAVLKASSNIGDYPAVPGRWEGIERKVYASLIHADSVEHIAITGQGKLDGSGQVWWDAFDTTDSLKRARDIYAREAPYPEDAPMNYPRPRVINIYRSQQILIRDITIINSPSWTVHPVYCTNVTIDNITIKQPYHTPNTDGINPDSSTEVRISNCHIDVGDDCIAIKSGYNSDGRRVGRPTENVVITNCTFKNGRGGVVIGSEMSGDVSNVLVSNSVFDGTLRGLRIKTARGRGGTVEQIRAGNLVMRDIPDAAISISSSYGWGNTEGLPEVDETTPHFRDFTFSNITITGANKVAEISGLPERPIDYLSISDLLVLRSREGISINHVNSLALANIQTEILFDTPLKLKNIETAKLQNLSAEAGWLNGPFLELETVSKLRFRDFLAQYPLSALISAGSETQNEVASAIEVPLFNEDLPIWQNRTGGESGPDISFGQFQDLLKRVGDKFSVESVEEMESGSLKVGIIKEGDKRVEKILD